MLLLFWFMGLHGRDVEGGELWEWFGERGGQDVVGVSSRRTRAGFDLGCCGVDLGDGKKRRDSLFGIRKGVDAAAHGEILVLVLVQRGRACPVGAASYRNLLGSGKE